MAPFDPFMVKPRLTVLSKFQWFLSLLLRSDSSARLWVINSVAAMLTIQVQGCTRCSSFKNKKCNYGTCWQTFFCIIESTFRPCVCHALAFFTGLTHVVLPGSHMRQTAAPRQLSCCWKLYFTQLLHLLGPKPGLESQLWTQLSYVHWQRARTCNNKNKENGQQRGQLLINHFAKKDKYNNIGKTIL